jgi:hypothetical protein
MPHPFFLVLDGELRRAALHAEADRCRSAHLAGGHGDPVRRVADLVAVLAVVVVLALIAATSFIGGEESPRNDGARLMREETRIVSQVASEHLLDPGAALLVDASRL